MSRNTFLREDLGAILLHSSDHDMRGLLSAGFLLNNPPAGFALKNRFLKKPLLDFAASKINAGNIVYALLSEKEYLLAEIEKSRKLLDERFYDLEPNEFVESFRTILCGKAIIDAAYFPTQFDFGLGFYGSAYSPRVGDILRAVDDERFNFLIPYYRDEVMPMLEKEHPRVVGISITAMFEIIPAFTLARLIKKFDPEVHITLGGVLVTELAQRISRNSPLWGMCDSLVLGPGEQAFSELISCVGSGSDLARVPNLIYHSNGSTKTSEVSEEFDLNEACTPEFVSLRPKTGLPLETSSSCYWGKCIFCYYPHQGSSKHDPLQAKKRVRRTELMLEDIQRLRDNYQPSVIGLTDSCVHPRRLEDIAEDNIDSKNPAKFFALFRLENEFKSRAFCRKLADGGFLGGYVGLESGSSRVNDIINKGIRHADIPIIIKNFYDTGILVHVYSIIGTPGETRDDAIQTYEFFKRWHKYLKLNWQIYPLYVLEQSPLGQNSAEFGIEAAPLPGDYLVEFMLYRMANGLSPEDAAALTIGYTEKLRRFMHPLNRIMDIESMKMFLMIQAARGFAPEKIKISAAGR
jgi:anaerobic magnesium-protoporphyrin IX monomethyl ester cyclase